MSEAGDVNIPYQEGTLDHQFSHARLPNPQPATIPNFFSPSTNPIRVSLIFFAGGDSRLVSLLIKDFRYITLESHGLKSCGCCRRKLHRCRRCACLTRPRIARTLPTSTQGSIWERVSRYLLFCASRLEVEYVYRNRRFLAGIS